MADVAIANTTAAISGKNVLSTDADATVTALHMFNRGSGSAPFAVGSGAAAVSNLDADKVDGIEGTALLAKAGGTMTGALIASAGTVSAPGLAVSGATNGVYASGTNALDFATNGTKALGIDSTQFVDSPTQPRCVAYHDTTQSLTNNTITALSLNQEDVDVGALHDLVTNNSRLTVPTGGDGFYLLMGQTQFAANATGERQLWIRKNGNNSLLLGYTLLTSVGAGNGTVLGVSAMVNLVAGDYVELMAHQNSGGSLNAGSASTGLGSIFRAVKLW